MSPIRVVNRTRGTVLGGKVELAGDLLGRLRGFLFRREPEAGEGILLSPCRAVHMFGMRFPLDVIFIDESGTVVGLYPDLRPWGWTPVHRRASHALELPAGTILGSDTRTGDELSWTTGGEEVDAREENGAGPARTGEEKPAESTLAKAPQRRPA